ncbi:putative ABC transport system ATP-binding protein [Paramicrobacterium humi]|uniref:Putative ABC transport system ATP-binding protein n=1 Tax=Paramicrobacterium humi TaxID=640635 RepID=A0A1H4MEK3_9MICO|nr:ABC transporter ATP-binding protein [Microbacterium humi]SEB80955.1 putative ABC transport system ATP-binding protein [Microbacterium humi]
MTTLLEARGLAKTFRRGGETVHACRDVDLDAREGELLVVRGASGSGKSTLLGLLAGLDEPDAGAVRIDGRDLAALDERERALLHRDDIGYVYQSFGLVPVLSAAENVELPLRARRVEPAERDARVAELLELVGMGSFGGHRPEELSGGQQQRIGIARAIANRPRLLIADEPTGQLDAATAAAVLDLFARLAHDDGTAVIVATHDPLLMARADRVRVMHDGALGDEVLRTQTA